MCLLNTTIVNQGLTMTITPKGSEDSVLLVAVPDGMQLIIGAGSVQLALHPNIAFLRPGLEPTYLQPQGRPPIPVHGGLDEVLPIWSC